MAIAKILTDGNTQIMVIPNDLHLNCDKVEISQVGLELRVVPMSAEKTDKGFEKFLKSISELGEFPNDVLETIEEARRNEVPSKREAL